MSIQIYTLEIGFTCACKFSSFPVYISLSELVTTLTNYHHSLFAVMLHYSHSFIFYKWSTVCMGPCDLYSTWVPEIKIMFYSQGEVHARVKCAHKMADDQKHPIAVFNQLLKRRAFSSLAIKQAES